MLSSVVPTHDIDLSLTWRDNLLASYASFICCGNIYIFSIDVTCMPKMCCGVAQWIEARIAVMFSYPL